MRRRSDANQVCVASSLSSSDSSSSPRLLLPALLSVSCRPSRLHPNSHILAPQCAAFLCEHDRAQRQPLSLDFHFFARLSLADSSAGRLNGSLATLSAAEFGALCVKLRSHAHAALDSDRVLASNRVATEAKRRAAKRELEPNCSPMEHFNALDPNCQPHVYGADKIQWLCVRAVSSRNGPRECQLAARRAPSAALHSSNPAQPSAKDHSEQVFPRQR